MANVSMRNKGYGKIAKNKSMVREEGRGGERDNKNNNITISKWRQADALTAQASTQNHDNSDTGQNEVKYGRRSNQNEVHCTSPESTWRLIHAQLISICMPYNQTV